MLHRGLEIEKNYFREKSSEKEVEHFTYKPLLGGRTER